MLKTISRKIWRKLKYQQRITSLHIEKFFQIYRSDQSVYTLWWLRSLNENYLLNKPLPWLSFEAIEYIQPRVKEGMKVFEYGSGGSTLFWLHHKAIVTSVEHDTQWYQKTKSYLAKLSTPQRVDYRQISRESLDA